MQPASAESKLEPLRRLLDEGQITPEVYQRAKEKVLHAARTPAAQPQPQPEPELEPDSSSEKKVEEQQQQQASDAAAQPTAGPIAGTDWERLPDEAGDLYFYNASTGDTTWDTPPEVAAAETAAAAAAAVALAEFYAFNY